MPENPRQDEFLSLYLQHKLRVDAYVRSLVPNRADADELLQDIATVLWRKFDDFEIGTRFDHWAGRIAQRHVFNFFRHRQRESLFFNEYVFTALAEEVMRQNDNWDDRRDALASCLKELSQPDRELVKARFLSGATNREAARLAGRSESAVSRALSRIYATLLGCVQRRLAMSIERGTS
jgi:RNA polymerase sigma-70 factor, ECF subfamily